jgi:hypothetical protein
MRAWLPVVVLIGCDTPDEWTCELEVNGVTVCVDLDGKAGKACKSDWGGTATDAEKEPGGPYEYCENLYAVACEGTLTEKGDGYTAGHYFYAATEEDCAAAAGATIGG